MRKLSWLLAPALALGLAVLVPAADPPKADAEQIAKLIKQLGSDEFEAREKATKELEQVGTPAVEALREAAKTGDAEVKTRAAGILEKVEKKAATEKLLAPTKVKLSFKDTPLKDALTEFNKKSGYTITVHDPDNKLKDRTVTVDTGEVTFWEAFDKFCEKAGLVEATWADLAKPVALPPGGGPGGGILPPPPPIVVPRDFKADPPAQPKEAPPPEKKDDGDKATPPPAAARAAARKAPPPGGGAGGAVVGGVMRVAPPVGLGAVGTIMVVEGKPKAVPTCYSGAVRIRALKDAPNIGLPFPVVPGGAPAAKDENHTVWLEVRPEPKLQLLTIESANVTKASDDQDQKLEMVTPAAAPAPGGLVLPGVPVAPVVRPAIQIGFGGGFGGAVPGFGGTQNYPVLLKKGEKEAKALKEFAGTLTSGVMTEEPVVTADKITKAAGQTFKGKDKDGAQVKVIEVKEEDGKITIKFTVEQPAAPGGIGLPGIRGAPVPLPAPAPPVPAIPPPAPPGAAAAKGGGAAVLVAQLQVGGPAIPPAPAGGPIAGPAARTWFPAPGITLVDEKGKTIAQTGGAPPKFEFNPTGASKAEYTQEYTLEKGQKPAKLVYSASKVVSVDIPFSFKDVPLK